jgi:hypothetical protein
MELAQSLIFDLGWCFFAAWTMVLAAVSAVAFGRDIFPLAVRGRSHAKRS